MVLNGEFKKAFKKFNQLENRGSYYPMFLKMIDKELGTEACLFILSTWNIGYFRYVKEFDINGFKKTMGKLDKHFKKFKNKKFKTINFDAYREEIKMIFNTLSAIEGVGYTGASKIMHLKNPSVFVMWDSYISGQKSKRYYKNLKIVRNGYWGLKKYKRDAEGYTQFLRNMQEIYETMSYRDNNKTLPKAIDEFNYVNITLPIRDKERREKEEKKAKKKKNG